MKGQFAITSVTFRLSEAPELRLGYGAIRSELEAAGVEEPTARSVSDAVIRIRRSKLPDPAVLGNAGSFFKNPVVGDDVSKALKAQFPEMPQYPTAGGVKLAAGWLIDQAGWKGHDRGDLRGVHDRQALVLVNKGRRHGSRDILQLAPRRCRKMWWTALAWTLEREVNVLPEAAQPGG